jgi:hypothetical protein
MAQHGGQIGVCGPTELRSQRLRPVPLNIAHCQQPRITMPAIRLRVAPSENPGTNNSNAYAHELHPPITL